MIPFDATAAILSYVRARGSAPEAAIVRAVEAREEEHHERLKEDSYENVNLVGLLAELAETRRLRWREAPGRKGDLSAPLVYSLSRREASKTTEADPGVRLARVLDAMAESVVTASGEELAEDAALEGRDLQADADRTRQVLLAAVETGAGR